jgi:recombination protein RecA
MTAIPGFRTAIKDGAFARGLEGFAASHRVPAVLQPSGVAELDAVLGGGFPRGSLVELCGPASSGRTSLSLALLAEATQREEACAFVDVSDSLDPASLAAAGVDIRRLLWIRCGGDEEKDSSHRTRSVSTTFLQNDVDASAFRPSKQIREKPTTGFLWQHPRDQMRGIETSIPSLVKRAGDQVFVAQPLLAVQGLQSLLNSQSHQRSTKPHSQPLAGARGKEWLCYSTSEIRKNGIEAQRQFSVAVPSSEIDVTARCAGEQAEPDRQRPRRGENVRRRLPRRQTQNIDPPPATKRTASPTKPWKRLEQALKVTDLLLHSGGWGVVVFDLGNISWVDARRIPLSTWFRFQRIVENTPTILLLLGEEPCAKSCASLVLRCQREQEKWSAVARANGTSGAGSTWSPRKDSPGCTGSGLYLFTQSFEGQPGQNQSPPETSPDSPIRSGIATFEGFEIQGKVVRSRRQLQPANSARWQTRTLWSGSF